MKKQDEQIVVLWKELREKYQELLRFAREHSTPSQYDEYLFSENVVSTLRVDPKGVLCAKCAGLPYRQRRGAIIVNPKDPVEDQFKGCPICLSDGVVEIEGSKTNAEVNLEHISS